MEEGINIIIGETVTVTSPSNIINLYIRNNDKLELYSIIKVPYIINHIDLLAIPEDPRYFLYEGYEKDTQGCRYRLMLKPFGNLKGIYRILNGINLHKVTDVEEIGKTLIRK